eukprot:8696691-Lingulodinium_polyedra.AAC.1
MILGQALEQILVKSSESIKFDVDTRRAELRLKDQMMNGRQIVHMVLNYFQTDQSLSTQYAFQDLQLI